MSQIINLTAGEENYLVDSPFQPEQPVEAFTATADNTLYAVNSPGINALRQGQGIDNSVSSTQKVLRIGLDGATVAFSSADYAALANAQVDSGTLGEDDKLRVVARITGNGQQHISLLNRVAASATPSAGEFKTSGSGPIVLTLGDAGNEGSVLEIWILDAADIYSKALAEGLPTEVNTKAVCLVDAGAATLTRLVSGGS